MRKQNTVSAMEWFAWVMIGILFLIARNNNGIFQGIGLHSAGVNLIYEKPIIYSLFLTTAVVVWIGIHMFHKQFQLERRMVFAAIASLMCIVYVISSFNAESPFLAQYGVLISLMVVIFFIAGTFFIQYDRLIIHFPKMYLIFGYIVVIYGFQNLLGNAYLLDSLSFIDGIRITSIFQYANAYAVLLLTMWIVMLVEIIRSPNKWFRMLHGFMLVPVLVSFLLTLSRGALIVLPVVAIVTLLMFKFKQQVLIIVYSVVGMGLSLLIYTHLEQAGTKVFERIQQARAEQVAFDTKSVFSSPAITSWLYIIGVSIIMAIFLYLIVKYVEPRITSRVEKITSVWIDRVVPISLICVFIIGAIAITSDWITQLLPAIIRTRVEDVNFQTHSVYERLTMYKDAIEIWKGSPIIGSGAGTWEAVYEQHQSYSYQSAQTHGYLTQLLIDVGLLGIIVYFGFIAVITFVYIRYYRKANETERNKLIFYFIVPMTTLVHSLIDFEMSYILYMVLVFLCLGVMAGTQRQPLGSSLSKQARVKIKWGACAIVVAIIMVIAIPSSKHLNSINKMKQSESDMRKNVSFDIIVQTLKDGLSQDKKNPVLLHQLTALNYDAYSQTQDKKYLDTANEYLIKLNKYEPNYRPAVEMGYSITASLGERDKAMDILLNDIKRYPFDQSLYNIAASELLNKWIVLQAAGSSDQEVVAKHIIDLHETMKSYEQKIIDLPDTITLLNRFAVSDVVREAASKVQEQQGN
ncbi:O-antigen ligase [Cohnella sp. WQ 127256]|uniref:O-antigen ligase family protein n=1 Tax=Cohnella sp. WQ 127256 TaxID=2938790 RepID=UPI0021186DEC|nr:O-antigen ligase family protein [Cohnella sp. WQ 127256]